MNSFAVALYVLIAGIGMIAMVLLLPRLFARVRPVQTFAAVIPSAVDLASSNDAVLLVQPGGRIVYTNSKAREWFGFQGDHPNLERLANKAQPRDVFFSLCVAEGQARFSLDGRLVEGVSYVIPYVAAPTKTKDTPTQAGDTMLVTLRRPQVTAIGEVGQRGSGQALDIFAELSHKMAASLDLDKTLFAILESVEHLVPADFLEITRWDATGQVLIPYRFIGLGDNRRLEIASERYEADKGYSGYLISQQKALLVSDVDTFREVRPAIDRRQYPFFSYLGTPLMAAGELIGTVELASLQRDAFDENSMEVLRILSGPAAIALKNAVLFEFEQRRKEEFSGLADLSRAVVDIKESQQLYEHLVKSISPLVAVKVLGFLIYFENRRMLEAQAPFQGIPQQMLELYLIRIAADSPAEKIWLEKGRLMTADAQQDPLFAEMGLNHMAVAAGIQQTVLEPLIASGRKLGYLQLADKLDGTTFDSDNLRLLEIIASQAAVAIENAMLVRQSQERAQRSEALRRIASLAGSAATLDEILTFSLRELARLFRADMGAILLLEENIGELQVHQASLFGVPNEMASQLGRISTTDPEFRETVTGSKRFFLSADLSQDQRLLSVYRPLVSTFKIRSVLAVPLVVRNQAVGELLLGSQAAGYFDRSDMTLVATTGTQIASAVEKSALYNQTDESLRRRVVQLLALTRIGRELNTTLQLERLLQLVFDEMLQSSQAECGSIVLFDDPASDKMVFSLGDSLKGALPNFEQQIVRRSEAAIVYDYEHLPEEQKQATPMHPGIRSALIVPIAFQEHVAGLISLHSHQPDVFDKTTLEIVQSLSIQAAIALGNAQRYQEQRERTELLNRRVETMTALLETSRAIQAGQPLAESLETIAYAIQAATPFDVVLISVYEPENQELRRYAGAGIPLETMRTLVERRQPWAAVQPLFQEEFRLSNSYLIPHDRSPSQIAPDAHRVRVASLLERFNGVAPDNNAWHPEDVLLVPLYGADGQPTGMISVDSPRTGNRPDAPAIDSLEIFASQATLVIETFNRVQELETQAMELQAETQRAQDALLEVRTHLPTLLHKDLEHTLSIQRLNQRSRRVRSGLNIAEAVSRQENRNDVLMVTGQEILSSLELNLVLVSEMSEGGPRLLHALGALPAGISPQSLLGQRNPLRAVLQSGEALYVSNIDETPEWRTSPLLTNLEARAFICLPIMSGVEAKSEVDAALLGISSSVVSPFSADDQQVFTLMSRQVSVALHNLRLMAETRHRLQELNLLLEFSRQLGSLDTGSILRTLVESIQQVIPAAHAGMVALWSEEDALLHPQVASGYIDNEKILKIPYREGEALPGEVFQNGVAARLDEINFARQYNLPSEYILLYRDATGGQLPVSSLIVPIMTFDTRLGVLVLDNFKTPAAFTAQDQALVTSLARQMALTLENVRLYQASEARAGQLQALTKVAGTITSSLQINDLISSLLDQVRLVIPYETGTFWLRQGEQLTVRAARGFADVEERVGLSVALKDSVLLREISTTSQPLNVGDVSKDERFPSLLEPRYLSWLGVPLLSKGEVIGLIVLEKAEADFYTADHLQAMVTFGGQAAVALENARLYEDSVSRAQELDERSRRLALLNRLSASLSESLDLQNILRVASQELLQAITSNAVSLVVFNVSAKAEVQAEDPRKTPDLPLELPDNPAFERLVETLGIFTSEDVTTEAELKPLKEYFSLFNTRSVLILPLPVSNELMGLALVHNEQAYRFTTEEVSLGLTICNQMAVAIQNARLFEESERLFTETQLRSAELAALYDLGVNLNQARDEQRLIDLTFVNLNNMLGPDAMLVALATSEDRMLVHSVDRGQEPEQIVIERQGSSFSEYVIQTARPLLIADTRQDRPVEGIPSGQPCRCWLGVPLIMRGQSVGVLAIQSYTPGAFGESQQRLLSQVANQLAVALDNAHLFEQVQSYAADLEQRVNERTEQVAREHRRIETLLSITTELSASLDLDMVLDRTLMVINDTVGSAHSVLLLQQVDSPNLYVRASHGYGSRDLPKGGQTSNLKRNEGLAGWVIFRRQSVLIDDLWEDERWERHGDATGVHRSCMAVPLLVGEESLGVLMLFNQEVGVFSDDQLDLVQATAKQIAVAINNAQLYGLIRDQAERLGDMLRTQHIETSRSQAILEAVADAVLVTDMRRNITLFNSAAERIIGVQRVDVLGRPLEHISGLLGKSAERWLQTIQTWTDDISSFSFGDMYAERIELDNRRVVAVHLSPVRLRSDFLGTVSILRDISHEVEVDRLKSEFVATVSHELRTPMTAIKGYVEIMLMGATGPLAPQQTQFLQVVKNNTERLTILVNDLLDVSRIEAGKITLSRQSLDLSEIMEEAIQNLTRRMKDEERVMEIARDIPENLPKVYGDRERVMQIFDNLLSNAYLYTHAGGVITVKMRPNEQNQVQVDVEDTGVGIKPEERKRIFERFYRGEDPLVLASAGNGLGLSITQTMVQMHGGTIGFDSPGPSGKGSVFSFTLPIYDPEKH